MKLKAVSGIMLTLLVANILILLTSPIPVIAQTNSTTTVYLDPPTINGTTIGVNNTVTVSIMIRDGHNVFAWQAGLTFNPDLLECTGFEEGEFLSDLGDTYFILGIINNTAGMIWPSGCTLSGEVPGANGSGRLAYATFTVKALGVSDIHVSSVKVLNYELREVPVNVIDIYTVVVDTTSNTVVIVSNLTGVTSEYDSGFYDHAFSISAEKISFKVTGPYTITDASGIHEVYGTFSNVTIPKTLLNVSTLDQWRVAIDGTLLSTGERIITENDTHTSIYFTYSAGFHYVQITTRPLLASIVTITLSSTNVILGSNVTISGDIAPVRPSVTVTILYRCKVYVWFSRWTTLVSLTADPGSHYSYTWTPENVGTYEFMAIWEGDDNTFGDVSDVQTLTVLRARTCVDIDPDTLNLMSKGKWITCYIELPEGYNVSDVDRATILLNDTIPVDPFWLDKPFESVIGDYDDDGVPDLMVKFNRAEVGEYIRCVKGITHGNVTLTMTGELHDGTLFEGSDVIKVRMPGEANSDDDDECVDIYDLVIPEFPSFIIMPLFMIATLLAVIVYRRKHST